MVSKKYRPWDPDQAYLFPPSMRDWLEEEIQKLLTEAEAVGRDKHNQESGVGEKSGDGENETWATMRAKLATEQGKKFSVLSS